MSKLTKNSLNEEISAELTEELKTGNPIVYFFDKAIVGKDGKNYIPAYICMTVPRKTKTTMFETLALGWQNFKIVRCIVNINPKVLENDGIMKDLLVLNKPMVISEEYKKSLNVSRVGIIESHTIVKPYDTAKPIFIQKREDYEDNQIMVDENGNYVYRTFSIEFDVTYEVRSLPNCRFVEVEEEEIKSFLAL